jgi:Putative restriction endonuclease
MPTLVMDPAPVEIDALIERRRRLDLDHYDEVWEGVLHMNPPPTEIVSPGDESWAKLPFYAAHDVDEMLIIDPREHSVAWLGLTDGEYRPIDRGGLIDLGSDHLPGQIDWP